MGGRLVVKYDAARLSTSAITEAVADTGMRAWLEHEQPQVVGTSSARLMLVSVSGAALACGLALAWWGAPQPLASPLFLRPSRPAACIPRRRALTRYALRSLDINVLMAVAVAGAIAIGEWAEAGTVVFLFALAQYLEARSMDRARNAIRALMDLTPVEARRVEDGVETKVVGGRRGARRRAAHPAGREGAARRRGDGWRERRQPGADHGRIAADRQAPGRRRVRRLDQRARRARHARDAAAARHDARPHHPPGRGSAGAARPTQAFVDRFARYYTPAVIALAVLIAVVPWARSASRSPSGCTARSCCS
jgi:Zn2+/Cd2+-exporting ATPase